MLESLAASTEQPMPICSRCGGEIEFRYIDGRCIPLHFSGGCGGSARSEVFDYPGYRRSRDGSCFRTKCPKCKEGVYFIRHNGGSVWIDPPLGPPWYKHPCMDNAYVAAKGVRSSTVSESDLAKFSQRDGLILGIVKEGEVSVSKHCSLINIETGKNINIVLLMKNNAGFLVGRLVLYDQRGQSVSLIENDGYTFGVITRLKPRLIRPDSLARRIECPECGGKIAVADIAEHLKRQHWFPRTIDLNEFPDQTPSPPRKLAPRREEKGKATGAQRICPSPLRWKDIHKQLVAHAKDHPCQPSLPPMPFILGGWVNSSDTEKASRWKETVDWASANDCAAIIEELSPEDFYQVEKPTTLSIGPMGGPCYRPWDFEPKVRPHEDELAKYLELLSRRWTEIAGPTLSAVTRPMAFTGKKARRLLVRSEAAAIPPWGGWAIRSTDEAKRRTFTRFRSAVNKAISPHEVDHIEFITEPEQVT
jgi:hypothetical protein